MAGDFLNLTNGIYKESTANVLDGEVLSCFSLKIPNKHTLYSFYLTLYKRSQPGLNARKIKQQRLEVVKLHDHM